MRTLRTGTSRSGFTLLELVVVVFILSLFAALAFPLFTSTGGQGVRADANRTASLLRYLNDSAIYRKETYTLQLNLGEGSLAWKGPDGEKSDRVASLAGIDLQSKGLIKDGQVTLFFGPLGIQENVGVLLREEGRELTVALNSTTGRVKVAEGGR